MPRWIFRNGRPVPIDSSIPDADTPALPSKPYIYIAAPYTQGDAFMNVRAAIDVAEELTRRGFVVFIPHLFALWNFVHPHSWEDWIKLDLAWLEHCDALFRVGGESRGADVEVAHALRSGVPVFSTFDELEAWAAQPPPICPCTLTAEPESSIDETGGTQGSNGANGAEGQIPHS